MKRRVLRLIRWTVWGLAATLAMVLAMLTVALTTEAGARVTLRMLAAKLAVDLEFTDLQGSLRGPLSLTGISGATATLEFTAEQLTFDWRPFQLIRGRVHVDSILLVGVRAVLTQDTLGTGAPAAQTDTLRVATGDSLILELPVAFVFDKIQLEDGSVAVSDSISINDISLAASGTHDAYRVETTATLTAPRVGHARLESSGQGTLRGFSIEELRATVLDGEVHGSGAFSWQPGVEWQATLDADSLVPSALAPNPEDWPGQVSLSAAIDGHLVDGRPEMEVRIDPLYGTLRGQPLTGVIRAGIRDSEYSFDRVDFDWGSVRIDVVGVINGDRLDLDFDLQAPDLAAVLPHSSGSMSASGRLAGSPSTPIINATATANAVVLDQFTLRRADARVDVDWQDRGTNEVDVRVENLEYSDQSIDSVRLVVTGSRAAHEVEAVVVSHEANVLLTASGGLTNWTWSGVVRDLSIDTRRAADWRLDERASLTASKTAVTLDELCLLASEGDFCVAGTWKSQAQWQVRSSMTELPFSLLGPLLPDALTIDGSVSGRVSAVGIARTPQYLELELRPSPGSIEYVLRDTVAAVTYRQAQLAINAAGDSLRGDLSLQLAESDDAEFGSLSAVLSVASLTELIDRVSADGFINALQHEWTLNSSIDRMPLSLLSPLLPDSLSIEGTVGGEFRAASRAGTPQYVELDLRGSSGSFEYVLRDTVAAVTYREAHLVVNAEGDSLRGDLSVQLAESDSGDFGDLSAEVAFPSIADLIDEITTDGFVAALQNDWMLNSSAEQIPLPIFNAFLPAGATLAGSLDGTLEAFAAPDGTITGRLELEPRTATSQRSFGNNVNTIRFIDTKVRAQAGPDGVRGEATFAVAQQDSPLQGTVSASIALPELTRLDQPLRSQPIEARVEGGIDLSLLDELFDDFSGSAGRFDVDLTAGNTLGEIEVSGDYHLRGQTDVMSLGIDLRDIDIRANDSPDGGLHIEGSVSSGEGQLTIAGTSPTIPTRETPARITIRGANFRAMGTEQISLVVSPDIDVLIAGRAVEVSGEVTVPRATIEIIEVPQTAVRVSQDVVYIGETEKTEAQPLDITADVTLELGENVVFRGFGFNTHLDGTVVASERPGRATQGRGELVLREGTYRGYGQNLAIEPGRLVFAGPMDDPAVDVRAYRHATDGTRAGFLVGGTLKTPTVEIWSDPAKTDSDALSYILFGRALSQGTEADQQQAGNAAAILGGNMLAMSMASKIGLDDARIETGTRRQDAAFYAGKYISPKLYVAYGVGLYEPINVLRVRYLISRKFSLQAETGTRDSGDILYRIEF